ncbi:hypothetical protein ABEB36_015369 [Hypothenemus hampei]|uniref:Uncharacterized protein n=1 Tax=Hypothenemus hampei TaxID=57062 RepID=A0ABD1E011_HYPHA
MTIRNILLLCFIAYAHGNAVRLTKEYDLAQEVAQRNPIQSLVGDTANFLLSPQTFESLLKYPENFVNNLASLLNRNPNPQPEDIIDVLNSEFGARLFVAQDDLVRIDSDSLNRLLTQGALDIAKQLYPNDYFKQWTAFITYKANINLVIAQLKPALQSTTLPLLSFTLEELTTGRHKIAKRDAAGVIQKRKNLESSTILLRETDVVTELISTLATYLVSILFYSVTGTLTDSYTGILGLLFSAFVGNVTEYLTEAMNSFLENL